MQQPNHKPRLILASRSPRRRELLAEAGYSFEVRPASETAECGLCSGENPAEMVARLAAKLVSWGVPPAQVVVEASSRNTRENAIECSRIAAAHGWRTLLVVTSAAHAPRALGCFRAVGLEPDLLPVDFRAGDGRNLGWLPRAVALQRSTAALRELAGRVVYRED